MSITLQQLIETARATTARDRGLVPEAELERRLELVRARRPDGRVPAANAGRLRAALRGQSMQVIAEVKGASPVTGTLRADLQPRALAASYAEAGAAAVSVLTEERFFGGSMQHLREVAEQVAVPVLRKDFIVEPYQVRQAALAGAAAVLLIAEALTADELAELVAVAHGLGLDALVEIHAAVSIPAAVDAGSGLIGVNNRDLQTMQVDWRHALEVSDQLPADVVRVAESGIERREQMVALREAGYDAALVGTSLVKAADPAAALRRLLAGGD